MDMHYLKNELYEIIKSDSKIFDFIQNGSLDGIWYWDLENMENEWMSPKFWEVLGYDPEMKKHLASEWQDIIFKDDLDIALDNFRKHYDDPKHPYDQIVRYRHKDGSTVWIRCRGIIVRDEMGKPVRMLGAHTDVTDIKQMNIKLAEAESAAKVKSQFLANMSHEIRTPINAIIGLNDLMNNTNLSKKQRDYVNKIDGSANMLLSLINDILDFSKIEAGKLSIEETKFSIEAVFSQIKDCMVLKAFEKGVELIFDMDKNLPEYVLGDPYRLEQVLLNLISNAIKFTDNGSIIIKAEVIENRDELIALQFSVKDTGIGIKEEQLNRLFTSFTQADVSTTRKYGGTGLGLVISKKLAEMMGGEIGVVSEYGEGSLFYFTVKVYQYNESSNKKTEIKDIPKCFLNSKILVVIENNYTRNVFSKYISELGNTPKLLAGGKEAIEELRNINYDLVVMDYKMKGLEGVESWHIIRGMLDGKKIPKIIMVTGYGTPEIIHAIESEYVDEVLIKPVTKSKLFDTIVNLTCKQLGERYLAETKFINKKNICKVYQGISILLVEDNEINQQVAKEILELKGFKVDVADNGQVALDKLNNKNIYDVILMDLQMPVMDGYEAAKHIRESENYNEIPIIALSADVMKDAKDEALNTGMDDYITKPINQTELFDKVIQWADKSSKKIIDCKKDKSIKKQDLIDTISHIDVKDGLERVNNNMNLYINIIRKFKKNYNDFVEMLLKHITDRDYENVKMKVHELKGVSATIGAIILNGMVKDIEKFMSSDEINNDLLVRKIERVKMELNSIFSEIDSVIET